MHGAPCANHPCPHPAHFLEPGQLQNQPQQRPVFQLEPTVPQSPEPVLHNQAERPEGLQPGPQESWHCFGQMHVPHQ